MYLGECIHWAGTISKRYGKIRSEGKRYRAHRFIYEKHHGPIPIGLVVCHKCDNPSCVNIEHLFIGTQKQNIQDCVDKKRHHYSKRTACSRGHTYTEQTTFWRGPGKKQRKCRVCANIIQKEYRYAK